VPQPHRRLPTLTFEVLPMVHVTRSQPPVKMNSHCNNAHQSIVGGAGHHLRRAPHALERDFRLRILATAGGAQIIDTKY
jgi:hypothetical protein